jgi:hypothetical protein
MILGCQRIYQRILAETSYSLMGMDSGGDEGLELDEEAEEAEEADEENAEEWALLE